MVRLGIVLAACAAAIVMSCGGDTSAPDAPSVVVMSSTGGAANGGASGTSAGSGASGAGTSGTSGASGHGGGGAASGHAGSSGASGHGGSSGASGHGGSSGATSSGGSSSGGSSSGGAGSSTTSGGASGAASGAAGQSGSGPSLPTCGCYYGDGLYCGSGVVDYGPKNGCTVDQAVSHPDWLFACKGGAWTVSQMCSMGCFVAPPMMNDGCNVPSTPNDYHLPWACGKTYECTQGNNGDICGSNGGDHTGVQQYAFDFGLPLDTPVLASRAGTVTAAKMNAPVGSACHDGCTQPFGSSAFWTCCNQCLNNANWVNVQHSDGSVMTYWHFDQITVSVGTVVAAGDQLGLSGTSGCSSGPHLHTQLMGNCPTSYCQSVPLSYVEAGVPACGQKVTSQNGCGG